MAITALPKATTHLLNSGQVLTTPTSLVKELVDNALDAKATSIDILISPNTLDRIEVRDNGHGIQPSDLDSLGRRGHTSKLRSFEELRLLGGITLGFRGEALASAVQLGEVSVTTKTEGEPVAVVAKLKPSGGIEHQGRTSHPVGTTVLVKNFMAKLPVRKKTFEKEATKTLAKVNRLLQAYALARPSIKLNLRITKGNKGSWSFAPHPSDGIKEAVLRVVGRDAALQCIETQINSGKGGSGIAADDVTGVITDGAAGHEGKPECFIFEAFLPSANSEPSKVGSGQYLSIDSRPVSHEKGTMKKIVTIFKRYIRGSLPDTPEKLKNPFIRLNIKCPVASYDANVEPAKDDVLFGDESFVLEAVEELFQSVYAGALATSSPAPPKTNGNNHESSFTKSLLSLPRADQDCVEEIAPTISLHPNVESPYHLEESSMAAELEIPEVAEENASSNKQRKWGFDMSEDFTSLAEGCERQNQHENVRTRLPDIDAGQSRQTTSLNPWAIAKMAVPYPRDSTLASSESISMPMPSPITPQSRRPHVPKFSVPYSANAQARETPRSGDNRDSTPKAASIFTQQSTISTPRDEPVTSDRRITPRYPRAEQAVAAGADSPDSRRRNDFVTARSIAENPLLSPPSTLPSKTSARVRGPNRPFVSPLRGIEGPQQGSLRQSRLLPSYDPPRTNEPGHQEASGDSDLAWAMDFEHRKEQASRQRREEIRATRVAEEVLAPTSVPRSSPHKNRYHAAIASLEASQPTSEQAEKPFQASLPSNDPRAYLMRRQKSMTSRAAKSGDPPRMMRENSTKLPLETVPREAQLHPLIQALPVEIYTLRLAATALAKDDAYINHGSGIAGLDMGAEEKTEVATRLQRVVEVWAKDTEGQKFEVDYNFGNLAHA